MKSILVIDKTPSAHRIREIANRSRINTIESTSGSDALRRFTVENDIELIILDIMVEGEEKSFELIAELKKKRETVPIIVLTSNLSKSCVIKGLKLGVSDYIVKPFDDETIQNRVFKHMNNRDKYLDRSFTADQFEIRKLLHKEILKSKKGGYPLTVMLGVFYNPEKIKKWERIKEFSHLSDSFTEQLKTVFFETDLIYTFESNTVLAILPFCGKKDRSLIINKVKAKGDEVLRNMGRPESKMSITLITAPEEAIKEGAREDEIIDIMLGEIESLVEMRRFTTTDIGA